MQHFFVTLNKTLEGRKRLFLVLFLLFMVVAGYLASGIRLEENLNAIIPDDQRISKISEVFDKSELADQIVFMLSLKDTSVTDPNQLILVADTLVEFLKNEKRLINEGIPFLTLVRIPGHIMLYVGSYEGRAALLHTIWGLRTRDLWGKQGRWVVGETVITTLEPGMERSSLSLGISNLRNRVESMNILPPASLP